MSWCISGVEFGDDAPLSLSLFFFIFIALPTDRGR